MNPLNIEEVCTYVNENIDKFHNHRVLITSKITLKQLISKNPYLFRAKNITKASELIEGTLNAFLSSSEEKLFGDFLEDLAIFVPINTTGGHKSACEGMDLEFQNKGIYHVVSIKSGPNWGNSAQHSRLATDFSNAERRLRQSSHVSNVQKILGICYGNTRTSSTEGGYIKVVGQNFWTFISDNQNLYVDIVEPVGFQAQQHNENYLREKDKITNLLTYDFIERFCDASGMINWNLLIQANSGNFDLDRFFGKP
jgi:hypothetical protein